jgi:hypothetical protein
VHFLAQSKLISVITNISFDTKLFEHLLFEKILGSSLQFDSHQIEAAVNAIFLHCCHSSEVSASPSISPNSAIHFTPLQSPPASPHPHFATDLTPNLSSSSPLPIDSLSSTTSVASLVIQLLPTVERTRPSLLSYYRRQGATFSAALRISTQMLSRFFYHSPVQIMSSLTNLLNGYLRMIPRHSMTILNQT